MAISNKSSVARFEGSGAPTASFPLAPIQNGAIYFDTLNTKFYRYTFTGGINGWVLIRNFINITSDPTTTTPVGATTDDIVIYNNILYIYSSSAWTSISGGLTMSQVNTLISNAISTTGTGAIRVGRGIIINASSLCSWTNNISVKGFQSRNGEDGTFEFGIILSGLPSPTGYLNFTLPNNLSANMSLLVNSGDQTVGMAEGIRQGSTFRTGLVELISSTKVTITSDGSGDSWSTSNPVNWSSGDYITLRFTVPISGWANNSVLPSTQITAGPGVGVNTVNGITTISSTLIQILSIITTAVTSSSLPDGLIIFQVAPTDGLPSGISLNDIVAKSGTTFTTYLAYANAPAAIQIGLTSITSTTYGKNGNGSWISLISQKSIYTEVRDGAKAYGSGGFAKRAFSTVTQNIGGAWDATNSWFSCPYNGIYAYEVEYAVPDSNNGDVYIDCSTSIGDNIPDGNWTNQTGGRKRAYASGLRNQSVGDRLQLIYFVTNAFTSNSAVLRIWYLGSLSNNVTSPIVIANYQSTSSGNLPTSISVIPFNTLLKDSFNSYNTSTGIFTCPLPGTYKVSAKIKSVVFSVMVQQTVTLQVYTTLGGSLSLFKEINSNTALASANASWSINGFCDIPNCVSGTQIALYGFTTANGVGQSGKAAENYIEILKITD